jgi:hypothetical protein
VEAVTALATGASFTGVIVMAIVAGADRAPLASVAVKVKASLPL